jgi:exo-beta-1,3-glucanase (GH17 family)
VKNSSQFWRTRKRRRLVPWNRWRAHKMKLLPQFQFAALLAIFSLAASVLAAETNAPVSLQQKKSDLLADIQKGICYSGFRHGQHPDRGDGAANPSEQEILQDLQILTRDGNFKMIRLYDCRTNSEVILRLIREHDFNLKVLLGAWLSEEMNNPACTWLKPIPAETLAANKKLNAGEVENSIRLANEYRDIVVAVAVGNETLVSWNDHMVPVESVMDYVRQVKKSVKQPVTVCDNYDWWSHHGAALARELDFISVHTYPEWENKDIDQAMPYTVANLQAVRNALPDARIVVTEAGWATVAKEFGDRASEAKQKKYYHDLFEWTRQMNITTFYFEAFDEDWKGDENEPLGAEKHWGLFTVGRKPKLVMQELYPDLKN